MSQQPGKITRQEFVNSQGSKFKVSSFDSDIDNMHIHVQSRSPIIEESPSSRNGMMYKNYDTTKYHIKIDDKGSSKYSLDIDLASNPEENTGKSVKRDNKTQKLRFEHKDNSEKIKIIQNEDQRYEYKIKYEPNNRTISIDYKDIGEEKDLKNYRTETYHTIRIKKNNPEDLSNYQSFRHQTQNQQDLSQYKSKIVIRREEKPFSVVVNEKQVVANEKQVVANEKQVVANEKQVVANEKQSKEGRIKKNIDGFKTTQSKMGSSKDQIEKSQSDRNSFSFEDQKYPRNQVYFDNAKQVSQFVLDEDKKKDRKDSEKSNDEILLEENPLKNKEIPLNIINQSQTKSKVFIPNQQKRSSQLKSSKIVEVEQKSFSKPTKSFMTPRKMPKVVQIELKSYESKPRSKSKNSERIQPDSFTIGKKEYLEGLRKKQNSKKKLQDNSRTLSKRHRTSLSPECQSITNRLYQSRIKHQPCRKYVEYESKMKSSRLKERLAEYSFIRRYMTDQQIERTILDFEKQGIPQKKWPMKLVNIVYQRCKAILYQ